MSDAHGDVNARFNCNVPACPRCGLLTQPRVHGVEDLPDVRQVDCAACGYAFVRFSTIIINETEIFQLLPEPVRDLEAANEETKRWKNEIQLSAALADLKKQCESEDERTRMI